MSNIRKILLSSGLILALGATQLASATVITSSLGNTSSGFNDGDILGAFLVGAAQGGQPAPFDASYGTDGLFGGNFSQNWAFNYGSITDTILSASLTIGIYDHDSSATGSQLALYGLDGNLLTAALDGLFEAGDGAADLQYNEYTIALNASLFSDLADGIASISLDLQGPGLVTPLFDPNASPETSTNGASLVFSTLSIVTQDAQPVPEPGSLALAGLGFLLMRIFHRRRISKEA